MNRKTSHLSYGKLCTKSYLKQLPPSLAKVVFRAKTRMLDIKTNYKNKYYENLECQKYNLPLKDENIKNMPEMDLKSIVKSSVYREAFLQLQVELSMNRKTSHLSYSKLCTKRYVEQLPPSLTKVVFRAKTRMLDIKSNYKNKYYENLECQKYNLPLKDENIKNMPEMDWK